MTTPQKYIVAIAALLAFSAAHAQDIPSDWELEVPHFYPQTMAQLTRGMVAITSDEDGHPTRIVGGNLDPHQVMGLGHDGDPNEYINTDIEGFQQGNNTCVYVVRQTRDYQQVERLSRALGSNQFIEMYSVGLECFDLHNGFETKYQLYTADSGGRMISGMNLALLSKYRLGAQGHDEAAWGCVARRMVNIAIAQAKQEQVKAEQDRIEAAETGIYKVGPDVTPPTLIYSVDAEFSQEARVQKIHGVSVVSLIVDTQGLPEQVHVVKRLGHGLDEQAIAAVRQYRFKPSMHQGKPVPVEVTIQVNFHIY
jgi:TonB family protein